MVFAKVAEGDRSLSSDGCGSWVPSGDAFLVYPGKEGPVSSIRLALLREAMQDIRALKLLEDLIGKQETVKLLEGNMDQPLTFKHYEKRASWLLEMRERVNQMVKAQLQKPETGN